MGAGRAQRTAARYPDRRRRERRRDDERVPVEVHRRRRGVERDGHPAGQRDRILERLDACGVREQDLPELQPVFQKRIWDRVRPGRARTARAGHRRAGAGGLRISRRRRQLDERPVVGARYENVLGPMEEASTLFFENAIAPGVRAASIGTVMRCSTCFHHRPAASATGDRAPGPTTAARSAAGPARSCDTTSDVCPRASQRLARGDPGCAAVSPRNED